jgi:Uncharacterized protein, 4-oxalocrotonate tautomerase homolog
LNNEFLYSKDRSVKNTIIEISMFVGRSDEVKKKLVSLIFERLRDIGFDPNDIEVTIFVTPKNNWGIRGLPGDELTLNYKVNL